MIQHVLETNFNGFPRYQPTTKEKKEKQEHMIAGNTNYKKFSSMSLEYVAPVVLILKYKSSYMSCKTFKNLPDCSIHLILRFIFVVLT